MIADITEHNTRRDDMRIKIRKRTTRILMVLFMLAATMTFSLPTSAKENQKNLVALGDSISTGYGLDGYRPGVGASGSYVEILKNSLNYTTTNFAVDGLTSSQLALATNPATIPEMQKKILKNTSIISITIGGNDLLNSLYTAMGLQMGTTDITLIQAAIVAGASGSITEAFQLKLAILSVAGNLKTLNDNFATQLTTIIGNLKTINPTATIVVQTIANPYKDIPNDVLVEALDTGVNALNSVIKAGASPVTYQFADVYETFKNSEEILTNATNPNMPLDPHPNAAGHRIIANLVSEQIGHSYADWVITLAPTCLNPGLKTRICKTCGDIEEETIPAIGHIWMDEFTIDEAATCTKEGVKSIHCLNCDEVKDRTAIPMIAHTATDWIVDKAATDHEEGSRHLECSVCKSVIEKETIAPLTTQDTTKDKDTISPDTGDTSRVGVLGAFALISAGVLFVIIKKKRFCNK